MPFASTEGFKDELFLGEFTTLPAVDSPVNFLIGRKLRQRRELWNSKGYREFEISLSSASKS
jgi:hypothetical protein